MAYPYQDKSLDIEFRISDLMQRLTLEEKIHLCSGCSNMEVGGIERLGIPKLQMSDGPQGVRTPTYRTEKGEQATAFPSGIALAATFDQQTAENYGEAIAMDCASLNIQSILGPGLNIMRTPLNGRNFEYFGEDPVLAGKIAAGYIKGCQSRKVAATPKHLACNNQEICRTTNSSDIDERTLREIYLTGFEILTKESNPWMMMSSYNRINGEYASECGTTQDMIVKREWGFDGVMVSDWGAVHDTLACALGGLDLEMGGPGYYFAPKRLMPEVENGNVPVNTIDDKVRRVLRLMYRTGVMDQELPSAKLGGEEQQETAEATAKDAITLLKNQDSFLPLDASKIKKITVIGPNADFRHHRGPLEMAGGSGAVYSDREITPLAGLQEYGTKHGFKVEYFPLCKFDHDINCPVNLFGSEGISCRYYHEKEDMEADKNLLFTETNHEGVWTFIGAGGQTAGGSMDKLPQDHFSVKMQMRIADTFTGAATLIVTGQHGGLSIKVNGKEAAVALPSGLISGKVDFAAGEGANSVIEIEYTTYYSPASRLSIGWQEALQPDMMDALLASAATSDAVIFAGGTNHLYDREALGWGNVTADIPDLELPGAQNEFIAKLTEVSKKVIVVLINGSVVNVEKWFDSVPALLEAWYPGERGGKVIAETLFGENNPAGRLPFTWAKQLNDYACHGNGSYPGNRADADPRVKYEEGVFVGYRHFDKAGIQPRFPFGYGLNYSSFECSAAGFEVIGTTPASTVASFAVKVKNTSATAGAEVIHLYVGAENPPTERPEKELKNFAKIRLAAGEEKIVTMNLKWRDFACWDNEAKRWVVPTGTYRISAGTNAGNIFASEKISFGSTDARVDIG